MGRRTCEYYPMVSSRPSLAPPIRGFVGEGTAEAFREIPSRRSIRLASTAEPTVMSAPVANSEILARTDQVPPGVKTQVPIGVATVVVSDQPVVPVSLQPATVATDVQGEVKEDPQKRSSGFLGFLRETGIVLVSALIVSWLIKTLLVQAFYIPSESMENTLDVGDRVIVSRLVPRFFDVHRGDIVVFTDPGDWLGDYVPVDRGPLGNAITTGLTWVGLFPQDTGNHLIKRAIGVPGDHVMCCDNEGRIVLNGIPVSEQLYLRPGSVPSQDPFDVTVPEDMLFVMGDNRQNSADSRYNQDKPYDGFVPMDNVVGTAFVVVWPFSNAGWLRNPGSVFQYVPSPSNL